MANELYKGTITGINVVKGTIIRINVVSEAPLSGAPLSQAAENDDRRQ